MTVEAAVGAVTPPRWRDRAANHLINWWRENVTLARIPLPMLSLAASFGVYQFSLLFVPWWVALAEAFAFEATYIGLSTLRVEDEKQRSRARLISQGSVAVSVIYNSLAAFLHRYPDFLDLFPGLWRILPEVILAVLHGAPLAIVAYFVADLLLHSEKPRPAETEPAWQSDVALLTEQIAALSGQLASLAETVSSNHIKSLQGEVATATNLANLSHSLERLIDKLAAPPLTHVCPDCNAGFTSASGLGGHRSRCPARKATPQPLLNGHGGKQ